MSTTVTYKGQTLATVSNDTKTLLTEGKYLEDDLTLVDVSGGGAVLTTKNISANGTYNASSDSADGYSQVTVAVPASAVDTGTKSITSNGTHDVVGYASANVNVPNSYSAGDEGKVVSNGALAAQTAHADVTPTTSDQTIDTTLNNSFKVKGDADLVASNIKKDVEIFGVTGTYEGSGGDGSDSISDFVSDAGDFETAYEITLDATKIREYAFYRSKVKIARLPNVLSFYEHSFENCAYLEEVYLNSYVGDRSWSGNQRGQYAFQNCTSLKKIYAPNCIYWGTSFSNNTSLVSLTDLVLSPDLDGVAGDSLRGAKITMFCYPKCTRIYNNVFRSCSLLETVDVSWANWNLESNVFTDASSLNTLIIRATSVRALNNISAFNGTPFANGGAGGTLYVPSSLISSYQAASNWSTILGYANNQIKAIEGSYYETHYADGTVIS